MSGIRIYELSKKINISNKEIIAKLAGMGIQAKSHMSNIDDETAKKLSDIFPQTQKPAAQTKAKKPAAAAVKAKSPAVKAKKATP